MKRFWLVLGLNIVGGALIIYDLLGPHSGLTVVGMLMVIFGAFLLREA